MATMDEERKARLAKQLRANLRRRKGQQRGRDDLSGQDPKRRNTLLHGEASESTPQDGRNQDDNA